MTCPPSPHNIFALPALVKLLLSGCGKRPPASTAAATNAAAVASSQPVSGTTDPFLTQQLWVFVQQKGRLPADFGELARNCLDSRPRPPAGMKWVIDATTQEVKLVPR